jgi:hypothetical protein
LNKKPPKYHPKTTSFSVFFFQNLKIKFYTKNPHILIVLGKTGGVPFLNPGGEAGSALLSVRGCGTARSSGTVVDQLGERQIS